ncbi:MAG: energy transducer TonB [Xanthobacteraceae bacterium]|nr:energy transducer TonB [Xanthobacteraceae bacterium]
MVESPQAEIATQAPVETPPDAANPTLLPQAEAKPEPTPDEMPVAPVPLPEPRPEAAKPVAPPKPPEPAKPKPEQARKPAPKPKDTVRRRIAARSDARTSERSAGAVSTRASTGAGLGRASRNANYAGQVSAHLQRHKQYPPEARARGDEGRATVSFSLDGGGRVTSVRLARSSGVASLDREVQAMVRRASPFPAPPDGRAQSFSVPVGFGLR